MTSGSNVYRRQDQTEADQKAGDGIISLHQSQVSNSQWGRGCTRKRISGGGLFWRLRTHQLGFVMTSFHQLFNVNNQKMKWNARMLRVQSGVDS